MRYFNDNGEIKAFEVNQGHLITDEMVELTNAELDAILNPPVQVVTPVSVERYQARIALHNAGKLDEVEAIMSDPGTSIIAREAWSGASSFRRDSVTVESLGAALGLSELDIDNLFIAASKIEG